MFSGTAFTAPVFAKRTDLPALEGIGAALSDDRVGISSAFSPSEHHATAAGGNWVAFNGR